MAMTMPMPISMTMANDDGHDDGYDNNLSLSEGQLFLTGLRVWWHRGWVVVEKSHKYARRARPKTPVQIS